MTSAPASSRQGAPRTLRRQFVTPEGIDLEFELGDASQRAGAFLIDLAIIIGILLAFSFLIGLLGVFGDFELWSPALLIVWLLGFFILRNFYFTIFELSAKAATPGKRIMGLRVASRQGGSLQAQSVLVRNAMRELEFFIPFGILLMGSSSDQLDGGMQLLSLMWALIFTFFPLFNPDRLRPGDLVGGTWVVRVPKQDLLPDLANQADATGPLYHFTPEQLGAYGIKELQVLETVLRSHNLDTMQAVAQRICAKINMPYRWDMSDERFLTAYYLALRGSLESGLLMGQRRQDKFDR